MDLERLWLDTKDTVVELAMTWGLRVVAALVLAIVGWLLARWVARRVQRLAEGRVDRTLVSVLAKIARFGVLAIVLVAVLGELGVDTASFLAFLGAAGLAIGLALKDTTSDIASGIVLLALRPFSVGDAVLIGSTGGVVDEIGIFQTTLVTFEGVPVVIPNSKVRSSEIQNYARSGRRRIELTISIAYGADVDRAIAVMHEVVKGDERILHDPAPLIDVADLADSSVDVLVRVWCVADQFFPTKLALGRRIKQGLDAAGIEIPFPQRVVHMRAVG
jgi:small conductance mechanosensitive channel